MTHLPALEGLIERLTPDHYAVLSLTAKRPFWGFPAGSNLWALTALDRDGINVDGEVVDELLRGGLLSATKRDKVHHGERSSNHDIAPDLDFEHEIAITDAGREALRSLTKLEG